MQHRGGSACAARPGLPDADAGPDVGLADGLGVGLADGLGVGLADGLGVGLADGLGVGLADELRRSARDCPTGPAPG